MCLGQDTKVTIRAVNKDERRALLRIKWLTPSRITAVILSPSKPGAVSCRTCKPCGARSALGSEIREYMLCHGVSPLASKSFHFMRASA